MQPRRGLSVTEVLIAIFIMAIGMISLLALFPVGMLRMAQAIRSNRVALAAANVQSQAEFQDLRSDPLVLAAIQADNNLYDANTASYRFANSPGVSCPVYVDPIGRWVYSSTTLGSGLAVNVNGQPATSVGIPRSNSRYADPNYLQGSAFRSALYRWYTLEDELSFNLGGGAVTGPAERERRISWAYLWRRPSWSEENVVDLSLVLYSGRQIAGTSSSVPEFRTTGPTGNYNSVNWNGRTFVAGSRRACLNWSSGVQAVRPGYWVLDATMVVPSGNSQPNWYLNGFFYQVTNVSDVDPATNNQEIELDRPALADGYVAVFPLGIVDVISKSDGQTPQ